MVFKKTHVPWNKDKKGVMPVPWNKDKKGVPEKTRRKMSEAHKGKKRRSFTEKTRKRMSQARKGIKFSQEHRRNLIISRNKRTDKPMLGKKHTEEFKRRMRLIKLGTKASEKTKKKQSRSLKKAYKNPKLRKKLSDAQMGRKVLPATRRKIGAKNRMNYSTPERQEFFREKRLHQVFPAKDTIIEKILQNGLRKNGIKFQKHKPILGQPDLFIEPNICIFADGDYWHGWDYLNGKKYDNFKKLNNEYFEKAIQRDKKNTKKLRENGYKVRRFWEHEIKENPEKCLQKIIKIIKEARK